MEKVAVMNENLELDRLAKENDNFKTEKTAVSEKGEKRSDKENCFLHKHKRQEGHEILLQSSGKSLR